MGILSSYAPRFCELEGEGTLVYTFSDEESDL